MSEINGQDVHLEKFTVDDLEKIVTCINIAFSETMAIFQNVHIRRTSREQLEKELNTKECEIWGFRSTEDVVVAVSIVYINCDNSGCLEMLSILPEYMELGLTSALIRNGENRLRALGKTVMKMKVFLPRDCNRSYFEKLRYCISSVHPWNEMKDVLKPDAYELWAMVTLAKDI